MDSDYNLFVLVKVFQSWGIIFFNVSIWRKMLLFFFLTQVAWECFDQAGGSYTGWLAGWLKVIIYSIFKTQFLIFHTSNLCFCPTITQTYSFWDKDYSSQQLQCLNIWMYCILDLHFCTGTWQEIFYMYYVLIHTVFF